MRNLRNSGMVIAGILSAATWAVAAEPASEERVRALEARIAELEAKQAQNSADLAAAMDAVLRDAQERSKLFASSGDATAGYDDGFFIRTGDFVLKPAVQMQFRYVTNFRDSAGSGSDDDNDDFEEGFELRRLRLELGGTAFTKDLTYFIQWETGRDGGDVFLLESWIRYSLSHDWAIHAGQFKDLVSHEFMMSSKNQLAADTSLVDNLIGGGFAYYIQGASMIYGGYADDRPLYVEAGFHDGASQENTSFLGRTEYEDPVPDAHTLDFGISGRAEYRIMGDWSAYRDFTAKGTKNRTLVVGAGSDWSQGGDGDLILGTADMQYETPTGLGAYTAFLVRHATDDLTGFGEGTDYGVLAQLSYLLNPHWEVFARYDVTIYDNEVALTRGGSQTGEFEDTFNEVTVGLNYYFGEDGRWKHKAKFTLDLTYLPDGAPRSVSGLGIINDTGGEDEWILRGQFQLVI